MLVGHLPALEDLLRHLVAAKDLPSPADGKLLPTGAIAHLRLPKSKKGKTLAGGAADLVAILRPRDEPARDPVEAPIS